MNSFVDILSKDILTIVDTLIEALIVKNTFDKSLISVDYFSKSKQGDVSTNVLIILRNLKNTSIYWKKNQ